MGGRQKRGWWWSVAVVLLWWSLVLGNEMVMVVLAERPLSSSGHHNIPSSSNSTSIIRKEIAEKDKHFLTNLLHYLFATGDSSYTHVWPEMELGWRVVVGSVVGFVGAALGSAGGVGGGGIFVPMLTLIIGFDPKTSTAISKCMIMGAAVSTVYYNLRLRHPIMDLPIIDYDLALLFQPMLMLGISIGVAFNVIFADWMVTVLLITLFLGTSTKALFKGIETWKKESIMNKEAARLLASSSKLNHSPALEYKPLPGGPTPNTQKFSSDEEVPFIENIYWREFTMLVLVWVAFLAVQMVKTYAKTCSLEYWLLNIMQAIMCWGLLAASMGIQRLTHQVPIAVSVTLYEAICLYRGKRTIASRGKQDMSWKVHLLILYCGLGILAGIVGGLLGLGGGFILGPLFLELGVPPQVASATSTFAMAFSSSMSVIQYYLIDRFPVPYAAYFVFLATVAAFTGQHIVRKLVVLLGRASLIIFILALTIFVSAISLGGVGIANMVEKLERKQHMGFENLCHNS